MLRPISLSIPSVCLYVSRLGLHGLMACVTVTDRHNAVIRTMPCSFTCARMCLLGVSLTLLPILGVKSPQNPNYWGVNRRFQAIKRAKYWKFHVIETTASISTKVCTTIETIQRSSWVVPVGAHQIQDGGRRPFWKKTVKSPYLCNHFTELIRFGTLTHIGLLQQIYR